MLSNEEIDKIKEETRMVDGYPCQKANHTYYELDKKEAELIFEQAKKANELEYLYGILEDRVLELEEIIWLNSKFTDEELEEMNDLSEAEPW